MTDNVLIIVFARTPVLGQVKTRLATQLGEGAALDIYKRLLRHTARCLKDLSCEKWIAYTPAFPDKDPFAASCASKHLQIGQHLGDRIHHAFASAFAQGYQKVLLIGSDCLQLTTDHLIRACDALTRVPCVFGPAKDGGYYLVGLRRPIPTLFQNIRWSTPTVLQESMRRLRVLQIPYRLLETLNDIDRPQDLPKSWRLRYPLQDSQEWSVEQDDA